jgi:hypothetical protein
MESSQKKEKYFNDIKLNLKFNQLPQYLESGNNSRIINNIHQVKKPKIDNSNNLKKLQCQLSSNQTLKEKENYSQNINLGLKTNTKSVSTTNSSLNTNKKILTKFSTNKTLKVANNKLDFEKIEPKKRPLTVDRRTIKNNLSSSTLNNLNRVKRANSKDIHYCPQIYSQKIIKNVN